MSSRSTAARTRRPPAPPAPPPAPSLRTGSLACAVTGQALNGAPRAYLKGTTTRWPILAVHLASALRATPALAPFFRRETKKGSLNTGTLDLVALVQRGGQLPNLLVSGLHASVQEGVKAEMRLIRDRDTPPAATA